MSYLITQTFIVLLIAGLLGMLLGWYLTRIAAANARAALQARLHTVESDAQTLRGERDTLINAKSACEMERRGLSDELMTLRARHASGDSELASLRAELAECRTALEAAVAPAAVSEREVDSVAIASAAAAASGALGLSSAVAPPPVDDALDDDNLQQIRGIGPKIASLLGELGVTRFEQIAAWTPENIEWVNEHLKFKGRVEREGWIPQAKALLAERSASD